MECITFNIFENEKLVDLDALVVVKRMALIYDYLLEMVDTINHCFSFQVYTIRVCTAA